MKEITIKVPNKAAEFVRPFVWLGNVARKGLRITAKVVAKGAQITVSILEKKEGK